MLIVIAGFPSAFVGILFTGALLIEVIFSLDGLGLLGFEAAINRDYPVMFGDALLLHPARPACMKLVGDLTYVARRPAHRLREPGGLSRDAGSYRDSERHARRRSIDAALANFRANRRGFWSLWIFVALFLVTPVRRASSPTTGRCSSAYDGAFYFPVVRSYPETDLRRLLRDRGGLHRPGGARADRRRRAGCSGRRSPSATTPIVHDLPTPAPSPPTWRNWLGTDDQARDVAARLIYGFRISVLFGLTLTMLSSVVGIAAGAVQGYFGGWIDLLFQRFIEIWSGLPTLYLLIILASVVTPSFWWLLGLLLLFQLDEAGRRGARRVPARPQLRLRARRARARGARRRASCSATCCPTRWWRRSPSCRSSPAAPWSRLTALDFLGFGLPPGSPSLGELLNQGKDNLQAPWLGAHRLLRDRRHAVAAGLRRRGGARRLRSAQDLRRSAGRGGARPPASDAARGGQRRRDGADALLEVDDLRVRFGTRRGARSTRCAASRSRSRRGETVALVGESGSGKSVTALSILQLLPYPAGAPSVGQHPLRATASSSARRRACSRTIRGDRIAMIFQEPMTSLNPLHTVERQIERDACMLHKRMSATAARRRARSSCSSWSASRTRSSAWPRIRTSSRAGSASG